MAFTEICSLPKLILVSLSYYSDLVEMRESEFKPHVCKKRSPVWCCRHVLILQSTIHVPQPSLKGRMVSVLQSPPFSILNHEEDYCAQLELRRDVDRQAQFIPVNLTMFLRYMPPHPLCKLAYLSTCLKINDQSMVRTMFCEEQ